MQNNTVLQREFAPLLLIFWFYSATLFAAEPLTLDAYYKAALEHSESAAIQLEQVRQAEENYAQASSAFLPTINAVASTTRIDPLPPGSPQTPSNLSQQNQARITLSQPLFRGMREYAALRQTRNILTAEEQDYRYAKVLLYRDVVQNFYTILSFESDIANYHEEIRLNRSRENDIRERVRIGRSRQSELLNLQSTISTLLATAEQLRGQLHVAREALAFLSGLDAKTALLDNTSSPAKLDPLQVYLDGVQNRPDIQSANQRVYAASEAMAVARGEHLPSIDLSGNYYLERPGYLKDSRWDLQLTLTVPLYAGGATQSKVRQANSQHHQAELTQAQRMRQAEQEIRANYQTVLLAQSQLHALQNATTAAKKSYAAQQREYSLGLVSNLEMIQSLTTFQQNQRALARASINLRNVYLQLLTSAAQRPTSLTDKNVKP